MEGVDREVVSFGSAVGAFEVGLPAIVVDGSVGCLIGLFKRLAVGAVADVGEDTDPAVAPTGGLILASDAAVGAIR